MTKHEIDDSGAAIVCSHIADDARPILYAERSRATAPEDSGWQFLCNSGVDEDFRSAKVWSINEVLEREPTLRPLIHKPPGTRLARADAASQWESI